jgi:hypothetical protein
MNNPLKYSANTNGVTRGNGTMPNRPSGFEQFNQEINKKLT